MMNRNLEELKKRFSTDEARKILEVCRTRIVFSTVQDAAATLSDRCLEVLQGMDGKESTGCH